MERDVLGWLADAALRSAAEGEPAPSVLRFLLRAYLDSGRDDIRHALGIGLAHALGAASSASALDEQVAWLELFAEAAAVADDERVVTAAADLQARQREVWERDQGELSVRLASIDVCVRALAGRPPQ